MNLKDFGIDAKVVALPGHTRGSVGLVIDDDKFIVGDALMNMFYPTILMLYTDEKAMRESAGKIGDMGNLKIYFGHGKPVGNRAWVNTPSRL